MKSSYFCLLLMIGAAVTHYLAPSDTLIIVGFMAGCSMYICRAIEKNGRDL